MSKQQNNNDQSDLVRQLMSLSRTELERKKREKEGGRTFNRILIALDTGSILFLVMLLLDGLRLKNAGLNIFTVITILVFLWFDYILIMGGRDRTSDLKIYDAVLNGETPEQLEAAKQAASKALAERHKNAERLLERCEEAGISSLDTEEDKSNLWIIAERMGIKSKEEAVALYQEGQNPSEEAIEAVKKERAENRALLYEIECNDLKRRLADYPPSLIGREKYTTWALALRTRIQKE